MSRIELKSSDLLEYEELKLKKQHSSSGKGGHGQSIEMAAESHSTPVSTKTQP